MTKIVFPERQGKEDVNDDNEIKMMMMMMMMKWDHCMWRELTSPQRDQG